MGRKMTKKTMEYLRSLKTIEDIRKSNFDFSLIDLYSQKNRVDFLWQTDGLFDEEKFNFFFKDGENPPVYKRKDLSKLDKKYKNFESFNEKDDELLEIYRHNKRYTYENEEIYHGGLNDSNWEFLTQMFRNNDDVQLIVKNAITSKACYTTVDNVLNIPKHIAKFKNSNKHHFYMSTGFSIKEKRLIEESGNFTGFKTGNEQMAGTHIMPFDIDLEFSNGKVRDPYIVYKMLKEYGAFKKFPEITYVVDSGKGLHLYILLDRNMFFELKEGGVRGVNYENCIKFHNSVHSLLCKVLKKGIADAATLYKSEWNKNNSDNFYPKNYLDGINIDFNLSTHGGHIRIPNTINPKTNRFCKIVEVNKRNNGYDNGTNVYRTNLSELQEFISNEKLYSYVAEDGLKTSKRGFSTNKRTEELDRAIKFFGENIVGIRNKFLQVYAFNEANKNKNEVEIANILFEINKKFAIPQPVSEVITTIPKIASNAIKAFRQFGGLSDKKIRCDYLNLDDQDAIENGLFCSDLCSKKRKNATSILDAQIVVAYYILKEKLEYKEVSFNALKKAVVGLRKGKNNVSKKSNLSSIGDIVEFGLDAALMILEKEGFKLEDICGEYFIYLSRAGNKKRHLLKIKDSKNEVEEVIIRLVKKYVEIKNKEEKRFNLRVMARKVAKVITLISGLDRKDYRKIVYGDDNREEVIIVRDMKKVVALTELLPQSISKLIIQPLRQLVSSDKLGSLRYYLYHKTT